MHLWQVLPVCVLFLSMVLPDHSWPAMGKAACNTPSGSSAHSPEIDPAAVGGGHKGSQVAQRIRAAQPGIGDELAADLVPQPGAISACSLGLGKLCRRHGD